MKAYGEGVQMGLTVLLDAQIDDYALTSSFFQGFKVRYKLFNVYLNYKPFQCPQ